MSNSVQTDGVELYKNNIYFFADEFIKNELNIEDDRDEKNKEIIKDNFVSMIFYIHDNIIKPSNDDINLLDSIFSIYTRLCSKYGVLPTLECFSFLIGVERRTLTQWSNGAYRAGQPHSDTVKRWFDTCRSFTVNRLSNQRGTDANLIFIAKAAYGMAEAVPNQPAEPQGIPMQSREQIAERYAGMIDEKPEMPDI